MEARHYIDVHAHIGSSVARLPAESQTIDEYREVMARTGTCAAIVSPMAGYRIDEGVENNIRVNEAVLTAVRDYPTEFPVALAIVELRLGTVRAAEAIERAIADGAVGFTVIPSLSGTPISDALLPSLEILNESSGLLLIHPSADCQNLVRRFARTFTKVKMIFAHGPLYSDDELQPLADLPNVLVDTSIGKRTVKSSLSALVAQFGVERVVFGGDTPIYSQATAIDFVETSDVSEAVKEAVALENARELIACYRPDWRTRSGSCPNQDV